MEEEGHQFFVGGKERDTIYRNKFSQVWLKEQKSISMD